MEKEFLLILEKANKIKKNVKQCILIGRWTQTPFNKLRHEFSTIIFITMKPELVHRQG